MSNKFPSNSTYRAEFTIVDRDGDPLNLSSAELSYVLSENLGQGPTLFDATEQDTSVVVEPNSETGRVDVTLEPSQVPEGKYYEELRVSLDGSIVVSQRTVFFSETITEPPSP